MDGVITDSSTTAEALHDAGPFDLNAGALAPVADEVALPALEVHGLIPEALTGTLLRNGPNPFSGRFNGSDMLGWWPEAAMLHAITLEDGKASYRNHWPRTRAWAGYHGRSDSETYPETNPNVNVIQHAGVTLALAEGGRPMALEAGPGVLSSYPALEHHGAIASGMTAHPKLDPVTGELIWFRSDWAEPYLRYGVLDASGNERVSQTVDIEAPGMMHDCAITERFSLLLDLPVGYDFTLLERGVRIPICWSGDRQARIAVIARGGGAPTWFEIEPCFIQHVVNAFETSTPGSQKADQIVLDVVRYPWFLKHDGTDFLRNPLGTLWRYELDLTSGRVYEHQVSELAVEMPRINESLTGRCHRYAYLVEQPTDQEMRGVLRMDCADGSWQRFSLPEGDQNSEPVFIPNPDSADETEGWVLVCVYRALTDTTDLLILDGSDIDREPLATVSLPRRIPAGFHGAWLPASR